MDEVLPILTEMERLLRSCHVYGYANMLEDVIQVIQTAPTKACDRLGGHGFWGGSGSFFDLLIAPENHHVSDDFARDNRAYARLLLRLLEALVRAGCIGRFDIQAIRRSLLLRSGAEPPSTHR